MIALVFRKSSEAAIAKDSSARAGKRKKAERFVLAALSSIPGSAVCSALASLDAETDQGYVNELQQQWLDEHRRKLEELGVPSRT